ncbi:MAG: glycosyltransferase [Planctomycetaceae bacterium]|nr:glycosyltransferase [Planctomycetaceae bacterium]
MDEQLSIVLPAHNEQEVLAETYRRLTATCASLAERGLDYELVFVNDGSTDHTGAKLDELVAADHHVRVAHLTRNFGHQAAVTAGLSLARGDVVVIMDADLQDPPEVLPDLLDKWREDYQVVYAVRQARKEWFGKRLAYWVFYRLYAAIGELDMPLDSGDFCLLDRSAADLLNGLPERQRFVRGLRTWIGLNQTGVEYERSARQAGQPSYSFRSLVRLAMDGLVSFSTMPLRVVTRLGLIGVLASAGLGLYVVGVTIYEKVKGDDTTPRGWAFTACLVLLLSSVQLLSLGVIGEYLSRIFLEVKGRPTFLIGRVTERSADEGSGEGA